MFSERSTRTILLIAVKVILSLSLFCKSAFATVEGDLELLKLVAHGYKANLAKLATWQGKAVISLDLFSTDDKIPSIRRKSSAEFLFDAEQDATRWYWNQLEGLRTRKGTQPVTEKPYFTSGIAKNKTLHMLFPVPPTPERPPRNVLIKPVGGKRIGGWNNEFNPMFYFQSIDRDWYKRLMFYYEKANSPHIGTLKIWKKGNIVFFETVNKRDPIFVHHEFDLSKGCCITKYVRNYDPNFSKIQVIWNIDYEQVNGVFVPKEIKNIHIKSDGSSKTTRVVQFVQNITNKPIDAEEFSLAKLRLIPGDIVRDQATGIMFIYKGEDG
ncbi:MAG: hypothetical protein ACETVZ_07650 [Phycisphaerae bacterium]